MRLGLASRIGSVSSSELNARARMRRKDGARARGKDRARARGKDRARRRGRASARGEVKALGQEYSRYGHWWG